MKPNQWWYCSIGHYILLTAILCSTYLIVNMTFELFYSIIRLHKAASFNTFKRAKINITSVIMFSFIYNGPVLYFSGNDGKICIINRLASEYFLAEFYYMLSIPVRFALPFVMLLAMNCVIIHTLHQRSKSNFTRSLGQDNKIKQTERKIYIMLLLVTSGFLILTTPAYVMSFTQTFFQTNTPNFIATFYFMYHIGDKIFYTDYRINFFLYVISGQKFRNDLKKLLFLNKTSSINAGSTSGSATSMTTTQSDTQRGSRPTVQQWGQQ